MFTRTLKLRLRPTCAQMTILNNNVEACRNLYNYMLGYRNWAYEEECVSLSQYDMQKYIPNAMYVHPVLENVYSQVRCEVCKRVDLAFRNFFRRVKNGETPGYPRYKGKGRYSSFTYTQFGFKIDEDAKTICLSKIGKIRYSDRRKIKGRIKTCTIGRNSVGTWFACITEEIDDNEDLKSNGPAVGIDIGIKQLAVLSDGTVYENPKLLEKAQKQLSKKQRQVSKHEKGTKERRKYLKHLRNANIKLNNKRRGYLHRITNNIVKEHSIIVMEDISVKQITEDVDVPAINRAYSSASWGIFTDMISYKAEEAGAILIFVDPKNTTQLCSRCGAYVHKTLKDRMHICPKCGLNIDHDQNAAVNILGMYLHTLADKA